jgi:hypothetical protein
VNATLAVAADNANVSTDGKLNILGAFQEYTASTFPDLVASVTLVISWDAEPVEFGTQKEVYITFMGPEPEWKVVLPPVAVAIPEASRPGEPATAHQIVTLRELPLLRPGPHAFSVVVGGEPKARIPLYVREPTGEQGKEAPNQWQKN